MNLVKHSLLLSTLLIGFTPKAECLEVKAIIFDCDGTLVDSEHGHYLAWYQALKNQGYEFPIEDYYSYVGNSTEKNAQSLAEKINCNNVEQIIIDKRFYFSTFQNNGFPLIQGTVDFLHRVYELKDQYGLKLGVASASKKVEILRNLRHLGVEDLFDIILSGCDDLSQYSDPEGVNKPKPYIYQHIAKELNILPGECIVIEDSSLGVRAAVDAGCITIAVPNSFTNRQDLSHAHFKIDSLSNVSLEQLFQMIQ